MTTTGPLLPGTGASNSSTGTTGWTNPGNVTADDGSDAIYGPPFSVDSSEYLLGTNYGASIGTDVIDSLTLSVEVSSKGGAPVENSIRLFHAGSPIGTDKSTGAGVTAGTHTYTWTSGQLGGLTPADLADSSFGVGYSVAVPSPTFPPGTDFVRVDKMTLTIDHHVAVDPVGTMGNPSGGAWLVLVGG